MKTSLSPYAIVSTLPLIKMWIVSKESNNKCSCIVFLSLSSSPGSPPSSSLSVSGVESADRIRLERILGVVKVGEAIPGQKLFAWTLQKPGNGMLKTSLSDSFIKRNTNLLLMILGKASSFPPLSHDLDLVITRFIEWYQTIQKASDLHFRRKSHEDLSRFGAEHE